MNKEPYSKSTFRGVVLLGVVLIVLFLLPDILYVFRTKEKTALSFYDIKDQKAIRKVDREGRNTYRTFKKGSRYVAPPEKFNPNNYSMEEWMALGLSEKQSAVILKFTKYKLKSNEDLRKIFVINDELFDLIKDSTYYDAIVPKEIQDRVPAAKEKSAVYIIDLNTASEEDFQKIRGVGPFFAKQIVKKRNELGGFYSIRQLLEVWKVDEEKLNQWAPYLQVDDGKVKKMNLNTASPEELQAHPYISWNLANSIVKLRLQNGPYKKIEEVKKSVLMTDELFEKLKRYLTI